MIKTLRTFLNLFFGKKYLQRLFEQIYYIGLLGMNHNNANFENNGELHLIKYLQRKTAQNSDLILFDVGANVGNYTQHLLGHFEDRTQIFSFEPSKLTFEKLQERFKDLSQVHCFQLGMGEKEAHLTLYSNEALSGFASVYEREIGHHHTMMQMQEEIYMQSLDNFCASHQIEKIDLLKLDVEGHEIAVLNGAEKMLKAKKIKYIQFEFGGCNIDSRTYFRDFWNMLHTDFNMYRVVRDGLQPIHQYNEKLEIFAYANFFAELKPDLIKEI